MIVDHRNNSNCFSIRALLTIIAIGGLSIIIQPTSVCAEIPERQIVLMSVDQSGSPKVENGIAEYRAVLTFSSNPPLYWSFYNERTKNFIIDCYGIEIIKGNAVAPVYGTLFKGIEVENLNTAMSLTKRQARILLATDPGWHFEVTERDDISLNVRAWRNIAPPPAPRKRNAPLRFILTMSAAAVGGAVAVVIIVLSNISN